MLIIQLDTSRWRLSMYNQSARSKFKHDCETNWFIQLTSSFPWLVVTANLTANKHTIEFSLGDRKHQLISHTREEQDKIFESCPLGCDLPPWAYMIGRLEPIGPWVFKGRTPRAPPPISYITNTTYQSSKVKQTTTMPLRWAGITWLPGYKWFICTHSVPAWLLKIPTGKLTFLQIAFHIP